MLRKSILWPYYWTDFQNFDIKSFEMSFPFQPCNQKNGIVMDPKKP